MSDQSNFWEKADSGSFVTYRGKYATTPDLVLKREGVYGLKINKNLEDLVPWSDIEKVVVKEDKAEWVLKEGNVVVIRHESDPANVEWYCQMEGVLQMWARQSGILTRLKSNGAPVYELDIPPFFIDCYSNRDVENVIKKDPNVIITKSFAYHYELREELKKIQEGTLVYFNK